MKKYWYVFVRIGMGCTNMGYVSDEENPLNNERVLDAVMGFNPELKRSDLVVSNFIQFENRQAYLDFWAK